jgi:hypothetical protein
MKPAPGLLALFILLGAALTHGQDNSTLITFSNLDSWRPLTFPKIPRHSEYRVVDSDGKLVLSVASQASASGIIHERSFKTEETPVISWRWKAMNVLAKGNAETKAGDDYPIRIYVIFRYDPSRASFLQRLQYQAAKAAYGEYPPHAGLSYVWANRAHQRRIITSAYTSRAVLVVADQGAEHLGQWRSHTVNIAEDYREAFGSAPPPEFSLAIMGDSDNTGESSTAYLDFVQVSSP